MKITASFTAFKEVWPSHTDHELPILYTVTPQGKIDKIYPLSGQFYEWVLDAGAPTEGDFLGVYGYAHKVSSVLP